MKKLSLIISSAFLLSFSSDELLNHPMPLLSNKTLDGKTIDANYYKGHVTVVSFMFIGCFGCMNEITPLNKIHDEYLSNDKVQILCVTRQMKEQMIDFNSNKKNYFNRLRKALEADSIHYSIQPACSNEISKMVINKETNNYNLESECTTIEDKYGINTFPTTFYIDKNGVIRKIDVGGPSTKDDSTFYNKVKKEIELLLAEK